MKILFAVPDRDLLHSYSRLLELDGHEVSCAFDGIQAITLIGSEKFDIAVLRENLPGTELKQLLDLLYGKGIPVAVILGRRVTSGMLCRREIACSYLPLPFLPDEMRTLIRVLIEKKRSGAVFRTGDVSVDSGCFSMEGIRVTNEDTGFRSMDRESVEIINMVTGANIRIRKREETINVCKAIDDLVKEKDTAVKEKFILLRERDEILRENDDIRRENDDIRRKNDDIRRERDDARRENDDIRKERDDIRREIDDIRRNNDDIRKERDDARRENDDIRKENDDIRKERDDARRNTLNEQCSILRSIMQNLSVSASEAMNIAGIPEEKRPLLAAELTKTAKA